MTPEEYEAHDDCADSFEEHGQSEDECHDANWSYGNPWNPDAAPEQLFMGRSEERRVGKEC